MPRWSPTDFLTLNNFKILPVQDAEPVIHDNPLHKELIVQDIKWFGLDCLESPIFWRYYIEKEDFKNYLIQLKGKYKFLDDQQVIYRLFQTDKFGKK